jgi:hypothetical protein
MIFKLLDQVLFLFVKAISYVAVGLVVGLWSLVVLALAVNIYKLFV